MSTQEKLEFIREFCPRMLDVELYFPGDAQLWQLLAGSSLKHGRHHILNGGGQADYNKELWTHCTEINTWVSVTGKMIQKDIMAYRWENQRYTTQAIIAWAPSFDEAVDILYNWVKEHATDETGKEYSTGPEMRFVKFD